MRQSCNLPPESAADSKVAESEAPSVAIEPSAIEVLLGYGTPVRLSKGIIRV